MSKHKTYSGNSSDNLNQNLSPEKLEKLTKEEMASLNPMAIQESLPIEGLKFAHDALYDFREITGNNLLKIIILMLFVSIYNPYNGRWYFHDDTIDTTHITTIYNTPKNQTENNNRNLNPSTNKESIVQTRNVLLEHRTSTYLLENKNVGKDLLSQASPPESVSDHTIENITTSENVETLDRGLITNNKTLIDAFTINIRNGIWVPISTKRLESDNSAGQSELIIIKPFKGKEITLLSSLINSYLKTNMEIKKGMVLYISSNGSISTIHNNIEYNPGGLANIPINAFDEPIIGKYPLGALLFRIGNDDYWKPYSASQPKIVAEKDGMLELMVNFKTTCVNCIKGNYAVGISTSQSEVD